MEYESQGLWKPARHLLYLCDVMEAVERGEVRRVMVFMPPRHGKSEVGSKKFPAWFLGRNPDKDIIISSYSADLAYDFSRIARNTLRDWGHLWGVEVASDSGAVGRWGIEGHRGGLVAAGVGGPITGRGAHVAIIDDPFKNWEEAASQTIRNRVWNWHRSTLRTRLAPGGAIVLIMTRWHEDDLAGRLIAHAKESGQEWMIVNFPQYAEEGDLLGREVGETLWPEWYPPEEIEEIKKDLGSYLFEAMHQQRPSPEEGDLFKRSWFRYFYEDEEYYVLVQPEGEEKRVKKSDCWIFQTVDPAATEKEKSDYFALSTFIVTPERDLLVSDVFREKAETTKHGAIMRSQYERHHPAFQGVENKTFGLNIIQGMRTSGLPIRPIKADTDKVSRARTVSARYEVGTVYHRRGASWLNVVEDELVTFPNGEHDDVVDTIAYAGIQVALTRRRKGKVKVRR